MVIVLAVLIFVGICTLIGFGGLVFNDRKRDMGITVFSGIFGCSCIVFPFLYLINKIY